VIDPDAETGPDTDWYRSELDACRKRIAELEEELDVTRAFAAVAAKVLAQ
jgi:hypothetical protein